MTPKQEKKQMEEAGFEWDPSWQGYARWTHKTLGTTALRQPYMTDQQWEQEKIEKIEQARQPCADIR